MIYQPSRIPVPMVVIFAAIAAGAIASLINAGAVISLLGLIPTRVIKDFWLWQTVTYMALHGGMLHLLFNALSLFLFGIPMNTVWGDKRFTLYFLFCGIGAAITTLIVMPNSSIPTIGVSGAIYGLMYAWAREFPDSIIYVYGILPLRAKHFVILMAVIELMLSQSPSPIARFAHLGGLAAGWIYFRIPSLSSLSFRIPKMERKEKVRNDQEVVDRILEKISKQGVNSLTREERETLDRFSKTGHA